MKKLFLIGLTAVALIGGVFAFNMARADKAEAAVPPCEVTVLNNKRINVQGRKAWVDIKVTGSNENCDKYATLVSWKSPSASGHPLTEQKLYKYTTKKLVVGMYSVAVELPECGYWQVDLLGQKRPTSLAGDANYDAMGTDVLVNFKLGGKPCAPPAPEKCKIPGMENLPANDPKCKVCPINPNMSADDPNCKEVPETPETPVTPAAAQELPKTGAGAFAAIASGVTAAGSGALHYVYRRKRM